SAILKALKRTMAAEYSRELSVKVYEGQWRLSELGFKMGGAPGYGLRRELVSVDGKRRRKLKTGNGKASQRIESFLFPDRRMKWSVFGIYFRLLQHYPLKTGDPAYIGRETNTAIVYALARLSSGPP